MRGVQPAALPGTASYCRKALAPTMLRPVLVLSLLLSFSLLARAAELVRISSPDKSVQVAVALKPQGQPNYTVRYGATEVLQASQLGLRLEGADLSRGLQLTHVEPARPLTSPTLDLTLPARGGFVLQP